MMAYIPFFNHNHCKVELTRMMQLALDDQQKIQSLNLQIQTLITQCNELKAINHYQTWELEKKIGDLEAKLVLYNKSKRVNISKAKDGNTVKIEDFAKE
jgi:predicted transglutaminase-like cysteine proteinase